MVIAPRVSALLALLTVSLPTFAQVTIRFGAGLVDATAARDRADLGGGTVAGAEGSFGGLRREVNWDGVPDSFAAPNNLPANFFNTTSPRGVVFSTPGTGFQVSASAASGTPVRFGSINPTYPDTFDAFSPERLFTSLGSMVTDVTFFVPGTNVPATVRGFGAMFSDPDGESMIEFFGPNGEDFGKFTPEIADGGVAFLGLMREDELRISRVRITSGNTTVGPNDGPGCGFPPCTTEDVVVLDDFIYTEPAVLATQSVPTAPAVMLALLGIALVAVAVLRMR